MLELHPLLEKIWFGITLCVFSFSCIGLTVASAIRSRLFSISIKRRPTNQPLILVFLHSACSLPHLQNEECIEAFPCCSVYYFFCRIGTMAHRTTFELFWLATTTKNRRDRLTRQVRHELRTFFLSLYLSSLVWAIIYSFVRSLPFDLRSSWWEKPQHTHILYVYYLCTMEIYRNRSCRQWGKLQVWTKTAQLKLFRNGM